MGNAAEDAEATGGLRRFLGLSTRAVSRSLRRSYKALYIGRPKGFTGLHKFV